MNLLQYLEAQRPLDGRIKFQGLDISVENAVGSVREGVDKKTGKPWKTTMRYPYGYVRMTEGTDGDHVDCYVGPEAEAAEAYVIHQNNPHTGKFDEDKVMLGFPSAKAAKEAYYAHYDKPEKFFGSLEAMPMEQFKQKVLKTKDKPQKIAARRMAMNLDTTTRLLYAHHQPG